MWVWVCVCVCECVCDICISMFVSKWQLFLGDKICNGLKCIKIANLNAFFFWKVCERVNILHMYIAFKCFLMLCILPFNALFICKYETTWMKSSCNILQKHVLHWNGETLTKNTYAWIFRKDFQSNNHQWRNIKHIAYINNTFNVLNILWVLTFHSKSCGTFDIGIVPLYSWLLRSSMCTMEIEQRIQQNCCCPIQVISCLPLLIPLSEMLHACNTFKLTN